MKNLASLAGLLLVAGLLVTPLTVPVASAAVTVCGFGVCTVTNTDSHNNVQTWTCGGSGNVIIQNGDNNTANVCSGGNGNQTDDSSIFAFSTGG